MLHIRTTCREADGAKLDFTKLKGDLAIVEKDLNKELLQSKAAEQAGAYHVACDESCQN